MVSCPRCGGVGKLQIGLTFGREDTEEAIPYLIDCGLCFGQGKVDSAEVIAMVLAEEINAKFIQRSQYAFSEIQKDQSGS